MTTRRHSLTLADGTTWPTPEPTTTLSTGTSWRLRYRPAEALSSGDLNHAAEIIDAYSRLCTATPDDRDAIISALNADLDSRTKKKAG